MLVKSAWLSDLHLYKIDVLPNNLQMGTISIGVRVAAMSSIERRDGLQFTFGPNELQPPLLNPIWNELAYCLGETEGLVATRFSVSQYYGA